MAFFRVELGGENIVFADDAGKFVRVFAGGKDGFGVFGSEVVAVYKVKARFLSDVFKQRMRAGYVLCSSPCAALSDDLRVHRFGWRRSV